MGDLDRARLQNTLDALSRRGGLRSPQREALAALAEAFEQVGSDLLEDADLLASSFEQLAGFDVSESGLAEGDFALATGVGKSRLAGAIIELLAGSGVSKTFMVLSHRGLLARRWRQILDPNYAKTVVPLFRGREGYAAATCASDLGGVKLGDSILVLTETVQTVTNARSTWWQDAFSDVDLRQLMRDRGDLVIIFDEAHHLRGDGTGAGWRGALSELDAKLILGLTATPRGNRHVIYEYSLARLLSEGKYSKHVEFVVDSDYGDATDKEQDRAALEIGLQYLERSRVHVEALPTEHALSGWSPAMLVAVSTIREVNEVKSMLVSDLGIDPKRILAITSKDASEKSLKKLLLFDDPGSHATDIVIAAFMLDEGWDVTRVSVIVPLRKLRSIGNAKQIIGRGLRLPAGRRLRDPLLDTLSVIVTGQESLLQIKKEVDDAFGVDVVGVKVPGDVPSTPAEGEVDEDSSGSPKARYTMTLRRRAGVSLAMPLLLPDELHKAFPAAWLTNSLSFSLTRVAAHTGELSLDTDTLVYRDLPGAIRQVAERVDYLTQQDIAEALEAWSSATGQEMPESISLARLEALIKEVLACCWFSWEQSGEVETLLPETLRVHSELDPAATLKKDANWRKGHWWTGWSRSAYDHARFDSEPEFICARILDSTSAVEWWLRNDPKLLRISTPPERYSPDFLVRWNHELVLIEVKGDNNFKDFWKPSIVESMAAWTRQMAAAEQPIRFEAIRSSEVEATLLHRLASTESNAE